MSRSLLSHAFARRELLGLGCAAGTALLAEQVSAAQNPAAAVADRTSSIRLTSLRATICRDRVFVKLGTNHGVSGWGEIKGVVPTVAAALADAMFELLDGQNPTRIEHLWQTLYRAERNQRGGAFMLHTIAGIDMALWDITGQLWGVPVYRLLGGPTRDKIRVYPSTEGRQDRQPAEAAIGRSGRHREDGRGRPRRRGSASARTARSCSTPTAPCPRRR